MADRTEPPTIPLNAKSYISAKAEEKLKKSATALKNRS